MDDRVVILLWASVNTCNDPNPLNTRSDKLKIEITRRYYNKKRRYYSTTKISPDKELHINFINLPRDAIV